MLRRLINRLVNRFIWLFSRHDPDFIIGGREDPYMLRWYLFGSTPALSYYKGRRPRRIMTVRPYLHQILRSDDDRAHHDHPNASIGICLRGRMVEHTIDAGGIHRRREITPGTIRFRSAKFAHRLEIAPGSSCWTIFVFFGPTRQWGFHCPNGWVPWKKFTAQHDPGQIGSGCDA